MTNNLHISLFSPPSCPPGGSPGDTIRHFTSDFIRGLLSLAPGSILLYFAALARLKHYSRAFHVLCISAAVGYVLGGVFQPLTCTVLRSGQLFGVAAFAFKSIDLLIRGRHIFPKYRHRPMPCDALVALGYVFELRYESFTPSFVPAPDMSLMNPTMEGENEIDPRKLDPKERKKVKKERRKAMHRKFRRTWKPTDLCLTEFQDYVLHVLFFVFFQVAFPQHHPTVVAVEALLAIYIVFETFHGILRYPSSPRLFGPLYHTVSINNFWSRRWHTCFACSCRTLAYDPVRQNLPAYGVPIPLTKALGIFASFALMACYHVVGLWPLCLPKALWRTAAFFLMHGLAAVVEYAVWGHKEHWVKATIAWAFALGTATWTAIGFESPHDPNMTWCKICQVGAN